MSASPSVLVASGDRLFAGAARRFLTERGWRVVGVATDGLQALAAVGRERPEALLVIPDLPRLGPPALARQVRRRHPGTTVVILGEVETDDAAVLPADVDADAVLAALESRPHAAPPASTEGPDRVALLRSLTSRERLVLKLLAEGVPVREISARLEVSQHTVRTHMQNLYSKLDAHSRLDVVRFAAEHGLVTGEAEPSAHEP
jgi:DNA-binding NarL/FixJ family response regulator